jgi:hypothetical protein
MCMHTQTRRRHKHGNRQTQTQTQTQTHVPRTKTREFHKTHKGSKVCVLSSVIEFVCVCVCVCVCKVEKTQRGGGTLEKNKMCMCVRCWVCAVYHRRSCT